MRLELVRLGLQAVGTHQFGDHETEAHAALGLVLEHIGRDRRLVGIFHAALLQVGARRVGQAFDLVAHQ